MAGEADDREQRDLAVSRSGVFKLARDPELISIVSFAAARYQSHFAGLSIITGRRQTILASVGFEVVEMPRKDSLCQFTIQRPGEPLVIPDASADNRFSQLSVVVGGPQIKFYAGCPIVDANGYPLGSLCIADREPRLEPFDTTDLMIRAREIERLLRW